MKKRGNVLKLLACGCVVLAVCVLACSCNLFKSDNKESGSDPGSAIVKGYSLRKVIRGDIKRTFTGTCTVTSFGGEKYAFEVGGCKLKSDFIRDGQQVKAGDVLATLDVEGGIETINEKLQSADLTKQEKDELRKKKQALEEIKDQSELLVIRSNIDGTVKYVNKKYVTTANPKEVEAGVIMAVVEPDSISCAQGVMNCDRNEAGKYTIGVNSKVTLRYDSSKEKITFDANIVGTSSSISGMSDTVTFFIDLSNAPEGVKVGDRLSVAFEEDADKQAINVLKVPINTVYSFGGRSFVYVLDSQGLRRECYVELGISDDNFYEIKSGLDEGDEIILFRDEG